MSLEVQVATIQSAIETFNSAIEAFESYSTDFVTDTVDKLTPMRSDFVSKITKTVENMTDTKAPEMLKKAKKYVDAVQETIDGFGAGDNALAEKIEGGENG